MRNVLRNVLKIIRLYFQRIATSLQRAGATTDSASSETGPESSRVPRQDERDAQRRAIEQYLAVVQGKEYRRHGEGSSTLMIRDATVYAHEVCAVCAVGVRTCALVSNCCELQPSGDTMENLNQCEGDSEINNSYAIVRNTEGCHYDFRDDNVRDDDYSDEPDLVVKYRGHFHPNSRYKQNA